MATGCSRTVRSKKPGLTETGLLFALIFIGYTQLSGYTAEYDCSGLIFNRLFKCLFYCRTI
jgi:hypothetical protein